MIIPSQIVLRDVSIPTLYLFILLGVLTFIYQFWMSGKKEGFGEQKLFDLSLLVIASSIVAQRLPFYYIFLAATLVVLAAVYVWKWSLFRILDLFSLALIYGALPV